MAATTTVTVANTLAAEIGQDLELEVRENAIVVEFTDYTELPQGYKSHGFARVTSTLSLSAITSGANEADAQSTSAIDATVATATPAVKAAFVLQSLLSIRTSMVNWAVQVPAIMGRAAADIQDVDAASLLAGFSNTVGTSGVDNSFAIMRQAMLSARTVAKGAAGLGMVFVLHPQQIDDVDADIQGGTGPALTTMMTRSDVVNWYGSIPGSGMLNNFRGGLLGVPVFSSTNVPTANAAADRAGALFLPKMALGGKYCWLPTIQEVDAIVNYIVGKVTAVTCAYAFVEKKDEYGISVITDA
jgi:hypothetical protein